MRIRCCIAPAFTYSTVYKVLDMDIDMDKVIESVGIELKNEIWDFSIPLYIYNSSFNVLHNRVHIPYYYITVYIHYIV